MRSLLCLSCDISGGGFCIFIRSFLFFVPFWTYRCFYLRCRYVGNVHTQVTEPLLQEVFASTGPVEACKLIRKEKVPFLSSCPFFHDCLSTHRFGILCREKMLKYVTPFFTLYSHPMDLFITLTVDQPHLQYWPSMEGICK